MPKRISDLKSDKIKKRKKQRIAIDLGKEKPKKTAVPRKKLKKRPKKRKKLKDTNIRELLPVKRLKQAASWVLQIAVVLLFAFVFVWYFGQRVSAVGDSMSPALSNGDVVLVNRFVYNTSSPKRGDIVAFKPKGNENSHYYIKRIIGLPGETVEIIEGKVYIDGEKLEESYETVDISDVGIITEKMVLGGDEYFVLGDDRARSEDSRMADVGNVKRSYIYGKVWFVVTPGPRFGFINH